MIDEKLINTFNKLWDQGYRWISKDKLDDPSFFCMSKKIGPGRRLTHSIEGLMYMAKTTELTYGDHNLTEEDIEKWLNLYVFAESINNKSKVLNSN